MTGEEIFPHHILSAGKNADAVFQDVRDTEAQGMARLMAGEGDPNAVAYDTTIQAQRGVLARMIGYGIEGAAVMADDVEDQAVNGRSADLFYLSGRYELVARMAKDDPDAQAFYKKLAALARVAGSTTIATTLYALKGPKDAAIVVDIGKSMLQEAYHEGLDEKTGNIMAEMLGELED